MGIMLAYVDPGDQKSPTPLRGKSKWSRTDTTRTGLLALTVALSAGIHAGLTPEHLKEMPRLGDSFIAAALLGSAIAVALVSRPDDHRLAAIAGLFVSARSSPGYCS